MKIKDITHTLKLLLAQRGTMGMETLESRVEALERRMNASAPKGRVDNIVGPILFKEDAEYIIEYLKHGYLDWAEKNIPECDMDGAKETLQITINKLREVSA